MREDPPVVLVADTVTRDLRTEIHLTAPVGSVLDGQWDDASSRGEGLVLLRGGRLLVAQEKRPRALIEFGPVGAGAEGSVERRRPRPRRVVGGAEWPGRVRPAVDVEAEVRGQEGPRRRQRDRDRLRRATCGCSATSRNGSDGLVSTIRSHLTTTRCATSTRSGTFPRVPRSPRGSRHSATVGCWWRSTPGRRRATA